MSQKTRYNIVDPETYTDAYYNDRNRDNFFGNR